MAAALAQLSDEGVRLIDEVPRHGSRETLIAFVHPKDMEGVLVELVQDPLIGLSSPQTHETGRRRVDQHRDIALGELPVGHQLVAWATCRIGSLAQRRRTLRSTTISLNAAACSSLNRWEPWYRFWMYQR